MKSEIMLYDLLLLVVIVSWAAVKIIDKTLIPKESSKEYTKRILLWNFVFAAPLVFFVHVPPYALLGTIFLVALINLFSNFSFYKGMRQDDVSRVEPFHQLSALFAVLLAFFFLGETLLLVQYGGVLLMVLGGFLISLEKPSTMLNGYVRNNKALAFVLFAAFLSGIALLLNKTLLNATVGVLTILFFRNAFHAAMVLPVMKPLNITMKWPLFLLARFLSTAGYALFYYVLSNQELSLTAPILAAQPLIVAFLGHQLLKEQVKSMKISGILLIIVGYVLLKM
jgi:drug/metabolite transporter (DMT)-like permease